MSSKSYDEESYGIVGTLQDGRGLCRSRETRIVGVAGTLYVQITFPNLRTIDAILDLNVKSTSPLANVFGICNKTITRDREGNPVVGFTVAEAPGTGTTAVFEGVVVGW